MKYLPLFTVSRLETGLKLTDRGKERPCLQTDWASFDLRLEGRLSDRNGLNGFSVAGCLDGIQMQHKTVVGTGAVYKEHGQLTDMITTSIHLTSYRLITRKSSDSSPLCHNTRPI